MIKMRLKINLRPSQTGSSSPKRRFFPMLLPVLAGGAVSITVILTDPFDTDNASLKHAIAVSDHRTTTASETREIDESLIKCGSQKPASTCRAEVSDLRQRISAGAEKRKQEISAIGRDLHSKNQSSAFLALFSIAAGALCSIYVSLRQGRKPNQEFERAAQNLLDRVAARDARQALDSGKGEQS